LKNHRVVKPWGPLLSKRFMKVDQILSVVFVLNVRITPVPEHVSKHSGSAVMLALGQRQCVHRQELLDVRMV
jgi:hypothetical protein